MGQIYTGRKHRYQLVPFNNPEFEAPLPLKHRVNLASSLARKNLPQHLEKLIELEVGLEKLVLSNAQDSRACLP